MTSEKDVTIVEVGPRDGLQNEKALVPIEAKLEFLDRLGSSGLGVIEATAFVSPRAIPQLSDASEVLTRLTRRPGVRYPVLVPNLNGLERALAAGATEIAIFTAASEAFNQHNINTTIEGSFQRFAPVMERARALGLWVRGYVSCALGCPYAGEIPVARTVEVTRRLFAIGCTEVSLGDTIGVGVPRQVAELCSALVADGIDLGRIALHFHDTRGTALSNVSEGLRQGVRIFDSSSGGLGGCPYATGASGNLATEDLVYLLERSGLRTGVDLDKVFEASSFVLRARARPPVSRVAQTLSSGSRWPLPAAPAGRT